MKRVVGLPREAIKIETEGLLEIDGMLIPLPKGLTWKAGYQSKVSGEPQPEHMSMTIPPDSLFVVGDNLEASYDSRHFGSVSFKNVLGQAIENP